MLSMGIDLGTTTLSVVLLDGDTGALLASRTVEHASFIDDGCPAGKVQSPDAIVSLALQAAEDLIRRHGAPACIGLTGQMHGALFVDAAGRAVSPLYTWQDGRAAIPGRDGTSAVRLLREAGCAASAGYGVATCLALMRSGDIPPTAAKLTTVSDYLGMRLTGRTSPLLSADMAASWGAFDLRERAFMAHALDGLGFDAGLLPEVCRGYAVIGETPAGVPVIASPGDNQASLLGSVRDMDNTALINIGTGSQISMATDRFIPCEGSVELRPCGDAGYILAGSGLCGGRAYALLERFFREAAGADAPRYDAMQAMARAFIDEQGADAAWRVRTTFSGTRSDPDARGSASGIGTENLRPGALIVGVIRGMLEELGDCYGEMRRLTGKSAGLLVGSGNGLRKNPLARELAEALFGLELKIPAHREEAAYGAALCAMASSGQRSLEQAQALIAYE